MLDRVLDPIFAGDAGRQVIEFEMDHAARARLEVLRDRANQGELTDAERSEYERFVDRLDLIATLKAEAKAALARRSEQ